jgi:hypothetical protein
MDNEKNIVIGFLVIVILIGLMILIKIFPHINFSTPIEMTIVKQNGSITEITNQRNPSYIQHYKIPNINFPEGTEFEHPGIGKFGLQTDFFADLYTVINIKKEGTYFFSVASDDGFQLWIDNNLIGEFISNRSFSTDQVNVYLNEGDHHFKLSYYQGWGRLGLVSFYQGFGDSTTYLIGKNSKYMSFKYDDTIQY